MKQYKVDYQAGTSRYGNKGVDYMLVKVPVKSPDGDDFEVELYAEEIPDPNDETATYDALKAEILRMADEAEIEPEKLKFWYD